jgi:hypothetical protein
MIIDDIYRNVVKVNEGSGILIKNSNQCYVLTAYHNIKNSILYNEDIKIKNDKNKKLFIQKYYYQEDKDIALFEVDCIANISVFRFDNNIKANDEITFIGYPNKGKGKRKRLHGFVDEWNDKNSIKVRGYNASSLEDEPTKEIIVGFSGSAVFKINDNKVSFIGLLKSLPEINLPYNEISCVSIKNILYFIENNGLFILEPSSKTKKQNNIMKSRNKINNPIFNFGENNNPSINMGSGDQHITYNQNTPRELSFDDAKNLFYEKRYAEAKNIFYDLMFNNDESKVFYIICSLANKKIYNINKYEIDDLYHLVEEIKDEKYLKFSNYLWLIIFYEYTNAHSIPKKLDRQHRQRRINAIRNPLSLEEKKLLYDIKIVTEKSSFL